VSHRALAPIARRQYGLVTRAQAVGVLRAAQVRQLLATGRLEPVRRSVYRVAGAPESWHQVLLAACLARPGSFVSFRAAAALWQLPGFDEGVLEVTVEGANRARLDQVIVHQTEVWAPDHGCSRLRIPTTSAARTLCDLTGVAHPRTVERAVDDALRRKLTSLRSLRRVAAALEGHGRSRCTVMRDLLAARRPGFDPGGSPPEVRIARLLVGAGLPEPEPQARFRSRGRTFRVDLAYREHGVVIEYDGWDHHSPRTAFDGDRARGNDLELLGLTVLRFTSASSDDAIVRTVRAALSRVSPAVHPSQRAAIVRASDG